MAKTSQIEIDTRTQEITVSDGSKMNLYVASPKDAKAAPGIIVLQEAFGVNSHIKDVTERFAREGYLAIAPELFHRSARNFVGPYNDFASVMPHYQALTTEGIQADIKACHAWLEAQPALARGQIAAIGYCMGGRAAYIANATVPLKAAVSYYGGGIAPDLLSLARNQHGPILMVWGGLDQHIPAEQHSKIAEALKAAKKPYINLVFSEADHGFFCDEKPQYSANASSEVWALTLQFLRNNLI
ncbi:MAG: dienelactone hydrolase family protein [Oligoflexia bacterium]|nr:dienelactone hydrolase family protein [Oligoflexia bacterium]